MFFPTATPLNKVTSLPPVPPKVALGATCEHTLSIPVPEKSRSRLFSGDNSDEAPSDASTDAGSSPKNGMKNGPRKEYVKEFKRK